nr:radical SAM protein [Actinomadura decatromicini]
MLAPTYQASAHIADRLDHDIKVMAGGHQAKAMPAQILTDPRMRRCEALVLGEAETRVAVLLDDHRARAELPGVMWMDPVLHRPVTGGRPGTSHHLAPDIDALPFVDRTFLPQDPHPSAGRIEANMVGARGCPYDCSFCGAAVSANPDITIRTRTADGIIAEMAQLREQHGVTAFRFVDDLFLGAQRIIKQMMRAFTTAGIGSWAVWDATGRINVLNRLPRRRPRPTRRQRPARGRPRHRIGLRADAGPHRQTHHPRHGPLGGAPFDRTRHRRQGLLHPRAAHRDTRADLAQTIDLVQDLWDLTDPLSGRFRTSAFEFRPYPGTPEWDRLIATGRYTAEQLMDYAAVDLTDAGDDEAMRSRDEFNFSVNLQFGEPTVTEIRAALVELTHQQHARNQAAK